MQIANLSTTYDTTYTNCIANGGKIELTDLLCLLSGEIQDLPSNSIYNIYIL